MVLKTFLNQKGCFGRSGSIVDALFLKSRERCLSLCCLPKQINTDDPYPSAPSARHPFHAYTESLWSPHPTLLSMGDRLFVLRRSLAIETSSQPVFGQGAAFGMGSSGDN